MDIPAVENETTINTIISIQLIMKYIPLYFEIILNSSNKTQV